MFSQHRMRAILVETHRQEFQAPSGAPSSAYAAPDEAFHFCKLVIYKYAAPLALSPSAVVSKTSRSTISHTGRKIP
jgi:hypothetical protein